MKNLIIFCLLPFSQFFAQETFIFSDPKTGLYGIIKDNKITVNAEYNIIIEKDQNLFLVENEFVGLITGKNERIISNTYSTIEIIDDNTFLVSRNGKYGLLDRKEDVIIPIENKKIDQISHDLFIARKTTEEELFSRAGRVELPFEYDNIQPFSEWDTILFDVSKSNLHGLYNLDSNKFILPIEYLDIRSEKSFLLVKSDDNADNFILLNKNGKPFNNAELSSISNLEQINQELNLFTVTINDKKGVIDSKGDITLPIIYDNILFEQGLFILESNGNKGVYKIDKNTCKSILSLDYDDIVIQNSIYLLKDNKWGCSDRNGNIFIPTEFREISGLGQTFLVSDSTKQGLLNDRGEILLPMEYDEIYPLKNENFLMLFINNKRGYADRNGKIIIPPEKDKFIKRKDDFFIVKENKKWGVFNHKGELIVPFEYDEINISYGNLIHLRQKNKWGCANSKGQIIVPTEFDYVGELVLAGVFYVSKKGKWGKINSSGQEVETLNKMTAIEIDEIFEINFYDGPDFFDDYLAFNGKEYETINKQGIPRKKLEPISIQLFESRGWNILNQ